MDPYISGQIGTYQAPVYTVAFYGASAKINVDITVISREPSVPK